MVNGQAMLDTLARSYLNLEARTQAAQRSVTAFDRAHGSVLRTMGTLGSAFGMMADRINNHTANLNKSSAATNSAASSTGHFEGTIVQLTKSMVLFGALLPLIHLPATLVGEFMNATKAAGDWTHQMIGVRQLLDEMTDTQFAKMNTQLQQLSVKWGLATTDMEAARKIMSTSNVVADDLNNKMDDQAKKLFLVDSAAKLAQATSTDLSKSWDTLATMAASLHLNTSELAQGIDLMKESIKSGRNTLEDFNSAGSRFLPMWANIINIGPTTEKMDRLNQLFTLYSQMSMSLGAQGAATAMGQLARNIEKPNAAMLGVMQQIKALREQGKTNIDIAPAMFAKEGPAAYVQDLSTAIAKDGPIVNQFIQRRNETLIRANKQQMNAAEEDAQRVTEQNHLEMIMFGARSARGVISVADKAQYDTILAQRNADLAAGSPTQRSADMAQQDLVKQEQRREAATLRLQIGLSSTINPLLTQANSRVADLLSSMVDTDQFQRADVIAKMQMAAGVLIKSFTDWFNTGGKAQIANAAYSLTRGIADAISGFVGKGQGQNIFADVGRTMADAIGAGIKDAMPGVLASVFTGPIGQGILGFELGRKLGLGVVPSAAVGFGAATLGQGSMGVPGQIVAGGIGVLGAGVLAKGALGGIASRARGVGSSINTAMQISGFQQAVAGGSVTAAGLANLGPAATYLYNANGGNINAAIAEGRASMALIPGGSVRHATAISQLQTLARNSRVSVTDSAGRFVNAGMGGPTGYNARTAAGAAAGAGRTASAIRGSVAMDLVGGAINIATADDKTKAIITTIGSVLGGIGGGALGGLAGGIGAPVGAMAGSAGGGMLAGTIYDQFQPGGRWGGIAQGGRGGATGQETLSISDPTTQTFIQAQIMALNASDINTRLAQLLIVQSRGGGSTAGLPGTSISAGAGSAGNIANAFTSQYGDKLLSKAEADAACGPAAVAFFAKAMGRNPTLREATDLAAKFGFTTGGGLPSSAAAGGMLTSMGVPNQVTTGSVDWERLKNGVGIVNIGPVPGKFPGHYFQVGGFDPATGKYNVGPSGSDLRGGSAQMSAAQMMAFGPAAGAVYSTGAIPGGGTGNATEQYIRAAAAARGIDPEIAVRAWKGEGSVTGAGQSNVMLNGVREQSFGPFQLNDKGWGAGAGFNTRDPNSWQQNVNYALDRVASGGWDPGGAGLHGATSAGISNWEGITRGGGRGNAISPDVLGGGGGDIYINGPIIGTAMLTSDQDINDTAEKLYVALKRISRGGMVSQNDQIKP